MQFLFTDYIFAALAAIFAGFINALAGGGTLITFPVLTAIGIPAVPANITNTVALCPGYLGATYTQLKDLKPQKNRLYFLIPVSILGGVAGGILLLFSGEKSFRQIVPYLILLASVLLAIQNPVKKWINKRIEKHAATHANKFVVFIMMFPAAVYGGYFGAGVSVIVLAVLGFIYDDSLTRLNALKQSISFFINTSAALFFIYTGQVEWLIAVIMALGALSGGAIGGKLAGKIKPSVLRWLVVTIGFIVGAIYLIK